MSACAPAPRGPTDRPDVLLVSIDTLRADRLGVYGAAETSTPLLDQWAERHAVVFENTVAQATWTLPSHTSLFTGLAAERHGVNHPFTGAPVRLTTLAERLHEAGYATAGFTGGGWLHPRYGLAQGFDQYECIEKPAGGRTEIALQVDHALAAVRDLSHPWLILLHTYHVHDYNLGKRRGAEPPTSEQLEALYDQRVREMDRELRRLVDAAGEENTVVVFTSDHGEGLGRIGPRGHGSLFDHNLLVPLILQLPGGRDAGRRIAAQVRSIDIVPTVLELARLPPDHELDGKSLLPVLHDESSARLASCYTPATDAGFALRLADGSKCVFDNAAWGPARDPVDRFSVLHDDTVVPAPDKAYLSLRERSVGLLEQSPGVRLRLVNGRPDAWLVTLEGQMLGEHALKTTDSRGATVTLESRGHVRAELDPGAGLTLVLERFRDGALRIGGAGDEYPLQLAALRGRVALEATPEGWQRTGEALPPGRRGVEIWRVGELGTEAVASAAEDAELRERLRALGYLD